MLFLSFLAKENRPDLICCLLFIPRLVWFGLVWLPFFSFPYIFTHIPSLLHNAMFDLSCFDSEIYVYFIICPVIHTFCVAVYILYCMHFPSGYTCEFAPSLNIRMHIHVSV